MRRIYIVECLMVSFVRVCACVCTWMFFFFLSRDFVALFDVLSIEHGGRCHRCVVGDVLLSEKTVDTPHHKKRGSRERERTGCTRSRSMPPRLFPFLLCRENSLEACENSCGSVWLCFDLLCFTRTRKRQEGRGEPTLVVFCRHANSLEPITACVCYFHTC